VYKAIMRKNSMARLAVCFARKQKNYIVRYLILQFLRKKL